MRLPIAPQLSTKDGISNKNARLTNALKETDGSAELAIIRPGLPLSLQTVGNGKGLVSFNGRLLSVYGSTIGYKTPIQTEPMKDLTPSAPVDSGAEAWFSTEDGSVVFGNAGLHTGDNYCFRWTEGGGEVRLSPPGMSSQFMGASSDGSVMIEYATTASPVNISRGYRWTEATGLVDLGDLGGDLGGFPNDISADGSVVVGVADLASGQRRPFRWTEATGMVDLGTLGGSYSAAYSVSADGSVVFGMSLLSDEITRCLFRWTEATGIVNLGEIGNGANITGVSADGSVVVGHTHMGTYRAFRWTEATGIVDLGTLGGSPGSRAYAVSADGSVVVGMSYINEFEYNPFRWTEATGMVDMGTLGGSYGTAYSVSADGTAIAGYAGVGAPDYNSHAFRWTEATGMVDLGTLGGDYSEAYFISPLGSVVVGFSTTATDITGDDHAFRVIVGDTIESIFTELSGPSFDFAQSTL